jgi:hypothetical protein
MTLSRNAVPSSTILTRPGFNTGQSYFGTGLLVRFG